MLHTIEQVVHKLKHHPSTELAWKTLNNKLTRNKIFHIIFNSLLFLLVAILIVLNLWGMNGHYSSLWISKIFLSMAIITAISGLLSAIVSIFRFKARSIELKRSINQIDKEYTKYINKEGIYSDKDTRDQELLKIVSNLSYIAK